jgi:hypothetical protein
MRCGAVFFMLKILRLSAKRMSPCATSSDLRSSIASALSTVRSDEPSRQTRLA